MRPRPRPQHIHLVTARTALVIGAAAFLVFAGSFVASPRAYAADAAPLVEQARKLIRQRDVKGALSALEQAVVADPSNIDANLLYQDTARDAIGTAALLTRYKGLAAAAPQDAFAQFLVVRLAAPEVAAKDFEALVKTFPTSPWPHTGRGRALADMGRYEEAVTSFDLAVQKAGPDASRFLAYRAWVLEQAGKMSLAVDAWKLVVSKAPNDLAAKLGLGEALRRFGSLDEAAATFEEVRKVSPQDPEAAWRIGLCDLDAARFDDALKHFDMALGIDRGMVEALCSASETHVRRAKAMATAEKRELTEENLSPAIGYGDRAVVSAPDNAYAHFTLGAAHEAAGEIVSEHLDVALKEYDAAIEKLPIPGPDKVRAFTAKSFVLLRLARWTEAQDAADRALGIDPKCAVAFGHGGHALAAQGKPKDAIDKYYKPGLKVAPNDARLSHDMGVALWELKKVTEAKKPLEDAVKLDPTNPAYLHTMGEWYYEVRRFKEGSAALSTATEYDPRNPFIWGSYAKCLYAAKTWEECARAFEKVIELDPEAVDEHLYVAVVYADQLKDKRKAKAHITKFQELGGSDVNLQPWMDSIIKDVTDKP